MDYPCLTLSVFWNPAIDYNLWKAQTPGFYFACVLPLSLRLSCCTKGFSSLFTSRNHIIYCFSLYTGRMTDIDLNRELKMSNLEVSSQIDSRIIRNEMLFLRNYRAILWQIIWLVTLWQRHCNVNNAQSDINHRVITKPIRL